MYNNVFNFMNEKELIYKYQFGFRQKHSTQQAIISLVDKITLLLLVLLITRISQPAE